MNKYKSLHLWMLIPMIVMQIGIYRDYWGDFYDNAWSVHIHYLTGTIWYLYLIIQPYFATHGQMARHRTNGIIGMFIAGGVCLTALSMMNRDIVNAQTVLANPQRFGPFKSWFLFGVDRLWVCYYNEYHPAKTSGRPCMVADINRFSDHDAGIGPRSTKLIRWNACTAVAQH
jgi:hypothetical protein